MPSASEVHAELEADLDSRLSEIRLIENLAKSAKDEEDCIRYRRIVVLLTYAHLEGFCRFSLMAYTSAINSKNISCASASPAIAAAGLSSVFGALRDVQKKHDAFRKELPDDSSLHLCAREQTFVIDYNSISQSTVRIPDKIVDTKSNVDTIVLKKLLFQLGLEYEHVERYRSSLNMLLGTRNAIAHGDRIKCPTSENVDEYLHTAIEIMSFLRDEVFNALSNLSYLREDAADVLA